MSNFYRAFEDRHRGSRALIKSRLEVYHPFLAPLAALASPPAALDLGCGRGEWLELLIESGFSARGVDLDDEMLAACRDRGFDVSTADAVSALQSQPDASLALVSAFHLVEHIPFDQVRELIAQALRVLQPGGLLILETPNPENLVVGTANFYTDPSHLRPIPPLLLDFAVEFGGFARHKIVRLQEAAALREAVPLELISVLGGVSPDYAVIAQKSAELTLTMAFDPAFAASFGVDLATLAQRYEAQQASQRHDTQVGIARISERIAAVEADRNGLFQRALDMISAANAQAQEAEARARQAEQQLRQQLNETTARAEKAERTIAELYASTSWRITRPVRGLKSLLMRRSSVPGNVERPVSAGKRAGMRSLMMSAVRRLVKHPGARRLAMRILARFPALEGRVRSLAYRAMHGKPAYAPPASGGMAQPSAGHAAFVPPVDLSHSAQKVFTQLQHGAQAGDD